MKKILVTGSNGFIAKNFIQFLIEQKNIEILKYDRQMSISDLETMILNADWIVHLAGVNRPLMENEFLEDNIQLTKVIASTLKKYNRRTPIILSSSIQVEREHLNLYGESKLESENILCDLYCEYGNPIYIYRLANVFGKWSRPNYNSVVATFCHNIVENLPIEIHNPHSEVRLIYIDDVIEAFWSCIQRDEQIDTEGKNRFFYIHPEYTLTIGVLAEIIKGFKESRDTLTIDNVGNGLRRALYSTYLSFLSPGNFDYSIPKYEDNRGRFVEMLKTQGAGQISYFTAYPNVTRGGHYHFSKNEKFLVIKGKALFRFKNILTGESYHLEVDDKIPRVIETVPGWAHDITNIGEGEMIVMLWANEIFDRNKPDTYTIKL